MGSVAIPLSMSDPPEGDEPETVDGTGLFAVGANSNAALATCNQYFPGYTTLGQQCDEYPFASTYQGASNGPSSYSAKPITASDNMSGGGQLVFYNFDRILDQYDYFYVAITS